MLKKSLLFLALAILATPSFAQSIGINNNGVQSGKATDMFYNCPTGTQLVSGSIAYSNCGNLMSAGTANGGYTSLTTIDSGIPVTYDMIRKAINTTGAGTSTDTLPNGQPGQILTIFITSCNSTNTWVVTPTTSSGFKSITFGGVSSNNLGQEAVFLYLNNTVGWIPLSYSGSTLPTVTLTTN